MSRKAFRAPAHWYDAESERHDVLKQDVPFFLGQLPSRRQSILELACGTGRACMPLALAGHRLTGIDYAPEMIDLARRKRHAAGLSERQLDLKVADMLDLNLGHTYDWACIFFNTFCNFTTLDAQDRVLSGAVRHLKPRGRLWVDVFNPDPNLVGAPEDSAHDPYIFNVPEENRTVFFSIHLRQSKQPQVQHVTHRYEWFDERGRRRRINHEFDMASIHPRELRLLVERHGLRVEEMWGNYDASPLDANSPRIIARCCRM